LTLLERGSPLDRAVGQILELGTHQVSTALRQRSPFAGQMPHAGIDPQLEEADEKSLAFGRLVM
jgi:hypothetical protein